MKEFSALGSGYKVAIRDLEIRGAGNLLGGEQHGALISVSFDLYCSLLAQTLAPHFLFWWGGGRGGKSVIYCTVFSVRDLKGRKTTMSDFTISPVRPTTDADYQIAIDDVFAEIDHIQARISIDQAHIQRLKAESDLIIAETAAIKAQTEARLDQLERMF